MYSFNDPMRKHISELNYYCIASINRSEYIIFDVWGGVLLKVYVCVYVCGCMCVYVCVCVCVCVCVISH